MSDTKVKLTKEELIDGAYKRLREYESQFTSNEVRCRIKKLKKSLISLARSTDCGEDVIKAHVCGSRKVGIATEESDVDIFMAIGGTFGGVKCDDGEWQLKCSLIFEREMKKRTREYDAVNVIDALVPIVRFKHLETKLDCDVNFRSGMSHQNSTLVKFYVNSNPKVKFVVAGVKYWMEEHKLADSNKFTSYAQVWLVLFFLMQRGVIPSVQKLRQMAPVQALMVEGWNCAVPKSKDERVQSVGTCHQSGVELLADFFDFYSDTTLARSVMRPHFGSTRKRSTFGKVLKINCEKRDELDRMPGLKRDFWSAFKIQDPFDMLKNLTKGLKRKDYQRFANLCKQTADLF